MLLSFQQSIWYQEIHSHASAWDRRHAYHRVTHDCCSGDDKSNGTGPFSEKPLATSSSLASFGESEKMSEDVSVRSEQASLLSLSKLVFSQTVLGLFGLFTPQLLLLRPDGMGDAESEGETESCFCSSTWASVAAACVYLWLCKYACEHEHKYTVMNVYRVSTQYIWYICMFLFP